MRRLKPLLHVSALAVVLVIAFFFYSAAQAPAPDSSYYVVYVTDGDTINVLVDGTPQSVRLIGIDAPELSHNEKKGQCFGEEAQEAITALVEKKNVSLVADPTQDDRDVYGRLLRYVIAEDGTKVNEYLVSEGYAREYTFIVPYQEQRVFKEAEVAAKEGKKGLWSECYPA